MPSSITNARLEDNLLTSNTTSATSNQASQDQLATLVEFHLFPKLPKELYLQTAEAALDVRAPRSFVIAYRHMRPAERRQKRPKDDFHKNLVHITQFPVPAFLHVHTEFRGAALKVYALSFSGPLDNNPVYFNLAKDILFFNGQLALSTMKKGSSSSAWNKIEEKLRYMTVGKDLSEPNEPLHMIARFHKLKVFAYQSHDQGWHHRSGTDAELRSVLEGNWNKSQEYEEPVAAANREASLIPEPAVKDIYELPKIEALKSHEVNAMVGDFKWEAGLEIHLESHSTKG
ncbi:hypothetical protein IFR05_008811 [Cadophora sp. M221]|nr:hypothetical protein IFR05_008811 [Cadophora sp. M221]